MVNRIPLKINGKQLCEIFAPDAQWWAERNGQQEAVTMETATDEDKREYSLKMLMLPTSVTLTSETYSRNAERTADYELEELLIVNRKSKPEFTWDYIRAEYVQNLLTFLGYTYNFKDDAGDVVPVNSPEITVTYTDFTGERTINAYLGQTISGTLTVLQTKETIQQDSTTGLSKTVMESEYWWQNFRLAFPEK